MSVMETRGTGAIPHDLCSFIHENLYQRQMLPGFHAVI